MEKSMERAREILDKPELLCLLAEECTELAKAALKLRRAMTGTIPTPMTETDAWRKFNEEVADVMLTLKVMEVPTDDAMVREIQEYKMKRFVRRLEERLEKEKKA